MTSAWHRGNVFEEAVCNQNFPHMYIRASGNIYGRSTKLNAREGRAHIYGNDGEPEDSHGGDATVRKVAKRRDLV